MDIQNVLENIIVYNNTRAVNRHYRLHTHITKSCDTTPFKASRWLCADLTPTHLTCINMSDTSLCMLVLVRVRVRVCVSVRINPATTVDSLFLAQLY